MILDFFEQHLNIIIPLIVIWTLPWKGVALWKSARAGQKTWFLVFLVVNTLAVLEIVYIFFFAKNSRAVPERRGLDSIGSLH